MLDTHVHICVQQVDTYNKLMISAIKAEDNELINLYENQNIVAKGYGLHPMFSFQFTQDLKNYIHSQLQYQNAFVSEIGLDQRQDILTSNPIEIQIDVFSQLLEMAIQLNKPCQIHLVSRGQMSCHILFQQILKKIINKFQNRPIIILHSYSGSLEQLTQINKIYPNILIGISHLNVGSKCILKLTQQTGKAEQIVEQLKQLLVLETDYCDQHQNYVDLMNQVSHLTNNSNIIQNNKFLIDYFSQQ